MSDDGFFWLLSQQRDATAIAKSRRQSREAQQEKRETVPIGQPSTPAAELARFPSQGPLEDSEQQQDAAPKTAVAGVLLALASGAADVPAFLQRNGFADHTPATEAMQAAATEALLAVLLPPLKSNGGASSEPSGVAQESDEIAAAAAAAVAACTVPSAVARLLELGADCSAVREQDGMMPLVAALSAGHMEAARLLLDAGAQPEPPAWAAAAAETAAAAAAAEGAATGAGAGRRAAAKRKRKESATPPAAAAEGGSARGDPEGVQPAVALQPTPLVLAVVAGSQDLVQRLLAAGADVNQQCTVQLAGGQAPVALTPLVAAVQTGSSPLVACLLEAGADVHQKCIRPGSSGVDWTSALSAALLGASHESVVQLVEAGACAARNRSGPVGQDHPALRAVVLAAQRGRLEAVELMYPLLAAALHGGSDSMLGMLRRRTIMHPLAAAAESGQVAVVKRLLELGAPPNHDRSVWAGVAQHTPLMLAAARGHLAVVDLLLAAGACPLKTNARQQTAAALSLQNGHLAVVRRLLEHAGEVEASVTEPAPALLKPAPSSFCPQLGNASKAWQLGWASSLLPRSQPASLAALEQERQRYRQALLALLGAHAGSSSGDSSSSSSGRAEAAALLRQLATPALVAHAAAGSEALLGTVLAAGISVGCVSPTDGTFPLMLAAHHGWEAMRRLLSRGADPNQSDSSGGTVLMLMAARPAMLDTAKQLLRWRTEQLGVQEQQAQEVGSSAAGAPGQELHHDGSGAAGSAAEAALTGTAQQPAQQLARQQLRERQQDGEHEHQQEHEQQQPQQEQQQQPIQQQQPPQEQLPQQQLALQPGTPQPPPPAPWRQLLDLTQQNSEGRDAVGVALVTKNRRFAEEVLAHIAASKAPPQRQLEAAAGVAAKAYELLAERGAKCVEDINKPRQGQHLLVEQVQGATRKQLRQVLALPGADLNVRDPATGRTLLMLLVARQQPSLVADLLASGRAELEARDPSGRTAALLAAQAGDAVMLRLLLDAGADVDCADNTGDTLLMALARQGQHKLLMELLQSRGAASLNCQDSRGWAALHHAAAAGHFNACRVLRAHGSDPGLCTVEGGKTAHDLARERGHAACLSLLKPDAHPAAAAPAGDT